MWKKINKQKCKDTQPQEEKNSLVKSAQIQRYEKEIDNNMLLSPKIDGKCSKTGKCKIGIEEVDKVMGGISEADIDKETDSKISKNFTKILGQQLEIKQSRVVPQSSSWNHLKSDHHSDQISVELHRPKINTDINKQKIAIINHDVLSHNPQSSKQNGSEQLEPSYSRTAQFKSFSLGRVKQSRNLRDMPQSRQFTTKELQTKWSQDEPVILYSEKDINQQKENEKIINIEQEKVIENQEGMEMQDFFNQMREAGIDISDLQSNNNKSKVDNTLQFDESPTFKRNSSEKKEIKKEKDEERFSIEKNMFQFEKQQVVQDKKGEQMPQQTTSIRKLIEQQIQLKKTKIKNKNEAETIRSVDIKKIKLILSKILKQVETVKAIKQGIQESLQKFQNKKNEAKKEIKRYSQGLVQMFNKLKQKVQDQQKFKISKADQNKATEQLKYKVLELQAEILQKQVTISRLAEQIQDYRVKNQELNESIFDKNQRIAQNQLILNKKVNDIIENYGIKQKQQKREKSNQQLLVEIQRLSEQVEELTRLYNNSQEQHKNVVQKQKVAFTIQMQKIARKEANWHQKEQILQEKAQKLQQQQANINNQKEKVIKRQQQLDVMQKKLEQKIMQVEKLEIELNEGFAFLEEAKEQNEERIERIEAEKEQFLAEIETLRKKVYHLEQQLFESKQKSVQYEKLKQKSIVSSLFEQESRTRGQRMKNGFHSQKNNRLLTEVASKNQKRARFTTNQNYQYGEEENENQYYGLKSKSKFNHHFCQINDGQKNRRGGQRQSDRFLESVKLINSKRQYHESPSSRRNQKYLSQVISSTGSLNSFPKVVFLQDHSNNDVKNINIKSLKARYQDSKSKYTFKKESPYKKSTSSLKLNELDSKIQNLRSEIKREIISAKKG